MLDAAGAFAVEPIPRERSVKRFLDRLPFGVDEIEDALFSAASPRSM